MGTFLKGNKNITIQECIEAIESIKNGKSISNIPTYINLDEPQKNFLWCVVNKY